MSFPRFFDPVELGKSLKEVATDFISAGDEKVISRWFHSAKDADLYIWQDSKSNVIKQQISFYGQVVEWNILEGVKTGVVVEFDSDNKLNSSEIVQFDRQPQTTPIGQAMHLLQHITGLKDGERTVLLENFNNPTSAQTMSASEFVERFGSFLEKAPKPKAGSNGLWSWLKSLFG